VKVPAPPPDLSALLASSVGDPHRLLQILRTPPENPSEYLPWDRLRFKTPPAGLTHDEWWLAVRLARRNAQRELPLLVDVGGNAFTATPAVRSPSVSRSPTPRRGTGTS
jgi:hypothetical protein